MTEPSVFGQRGYPWEGFSIWRIDLFLPRGFEVRIFFDLYALQFDETACLLFLFYNELKSWVG